VEDDETPVFTPNSSTLSPQVPPLGLHHPQHQRPSFSLRAPSVSPGGTLSGSLRGSPAIPEHVAQSLPLLQTNARAGLLQPLYAEAYRSCHVRFSLEAYECLEVEHDLTEDAAVWQIERNRPSVRQANGSGVSRKLNGGSALMGKLVPAPLKRTTMRIRRLFLPLLLPFPLRVLFLLFLFAAFLAGAVLLLNPWPATTSLSISSMRAALSPSGSYSPDYSVLEHPLFWPGLFCWFLCWSGARFVPTRFNALRLALRAQDAVFAGGPTRIALEAAETMAALASRASPPASSPLGFAGTTQPQLLAVQSVGGSAMNSTPPPMDGGSASSTRSSSIGSDSDAVVQTRNRSLSDAAALAAERASQTANEVSACLTAFAMSDQAWFLSLCISRSLLASTPSPPASSSSLARRRSVWSAPSGGIAGMLVLPLLLAAGTGVFILLWQTLSATTGMVLHAIELSPATVSAGESLAFPNAAGGGFGGAGGGGSLIRNNPAGGPGGSPGAAGVLFVAVLTSLSFPLVSLTVTFQLARIAVLSRAGHLFLQVLLFLTQAYHLIFNLLIGSSSSITANAGSPSIVSVSNSPQPDLTRAAAQWSRGTLVVTGTSGVETLNCSSSAKLRAESGAGILHIVDRGTVSKRRGRG
jgi:hypothetical protein